MLDGRKMFTGGISPLVVDRWIDKILQDVHDWHEGVQLPPLVEDINFHTQFNPMPLLGKNEE